MPARWVCERVTIRCVVFDVDDTLYLERDYVRSGFEAVGSWFEDFTGVAGFSESAWALFLSGRRGDTFNQALDELGLEPDSGLIAELVDRYRAHRPVIQLLPDAQACLKRVSQSAAVAIITDGPLLSQRAKVETLGLASWAAPILLTDELGPEYAKPDPGAFRLVEDACGARGAACVYVADNPAKDFIASGSLGWRSIRVRRAGSLHRDVPTSDGVDIEVADLAGVADFLNLSG